MDEGCLESRNRRVENRGRALDVASDEAEELEHQGEWGLTPIHDALLYTERLEAGQVTVVVFDRVALQRRRERCSYLS